MTSEVGRLPPGAVIAGAYRVEAFVAEGGMGAVYRARHLRLERDVALKVLPPLPGPETERSERFHREALALASLRHPNVVRLFDQGVHEGMAFIAMEYQPWPTLKQTLAALPRGLPLEAARRVVADVAAGLAAAHAGGLVHRDLKPSNVFVTGDGHGVLSDFGLARFGGAAALTRTGEVVGTPAYLPPEVAAGGRADARSDQWQLGLVLYEALTGEPAWPPLAVRALDAAGLALLYQPPSSRAPAVPAWLDQVVARALATEPDRRFRSVDDFRSALVQGRPSEGPLSLGATVVADVVRPPRAAAGAGAGAPGARRFALALSVGLLGVLALALARREAWPPRPPTPPTARAPAGPTTPPPPPLVTPRLVVVNAGPGLLEVLVPGAPAGEALPRLRDGAGIELIDASAAADEQGWRLGARNLPPGRPLRVTFDPAPGSTPRWACPPLALAAPGGRPPRDGPALNLVVCAFDRPDTRRSRLSDGAPGWLARRGVARVCLAFFPGADPAGLADDAARLDAAGVTPEVALVLARRPAAGTDTLEAVGTLVERCGRSVRRWYVGWAVDWHGWAGERAGYREFLRELRDLIRRKQPEAHVLPGALVTLATLDLFDELLGAREVAAPEGFCIELKPCSAEPSDEVGPRIGRYRDAARRRQLACPPWTLSVCQPSPYRTAVDSPASRLVASLGQADDRGATLPLLQDEALSRTFAMPPSEPSEAARTLAEALVRGRARGASSVGWTPPYEACRHLFAAAATPSATSGESPAHVQSYGVLHRVSAWLAGAEPRGTPGEAFELERLGLRRAAGPPLECLPFRRAGDQEVLVVLPGRGGPTRLAALTPGSFIRVAPLVPSPDAPSDEVRLEFWGPVQGVTEAPLEGPACLFPVVPLDAPAAPPPLAPAAR